MKNVNVKKLIFYLLITLVIGSLPSLFIYGSIGSYDSLNKPLLSPPSIIFPIVWSILYILMSISIYRVMMSENINKDEAKLIYFIQLITNALWTSIFFYFKEYFLSFLWIIMLIVFVSAMFIKFLKIDKVSAYIQIPYLIWLLFAAYLNFGIFVLN